MPEAQAGAEPQQSLREVGKEAAARAAWSPLHALEARTQHQERKGDFGKMLELQGVLPAVCLADFPLHT